MNPGDTPGVLQVHDLLLASFPAGQVEDRVSFLDTVSPDAEPGAAPLVVAAYKEGRLVGAVAGAYLPRVNAAMVLYAAVRAQARRRGLYHAMRTRLIESLGAKARAAGRRDVDYIVSEVDPTGPIYLRYLAPRRAYAAPCEYWQPNAQGLSARRLTLALQPVHKKTPAAGREIGDLVHEIYRSVYRIPNPGEDPICRRVIQSLDTLHDGNSKR